MKITTLRQAGKKGGQNRKVNFDKRRHALFVELSKLTDKFWLDVIQFSQKRWSNDDIEELIIKLRNEN